MGIPVLIIGKSGSGKSASLRNFKHDEIGLINILGKPLPFRGKFDGEYISDNYSSIKQVISRGKKKVVIIDDAGYLITNMFMKEHSIAGKGNDIFRLYNSLADEFWKLVTCVKEELPQEMIVYFTMHEDKNDYGDIKPKTVGKLLDEKVCVEGMFTIVLRAVKTSDGHKFLTRCDGLDTVKSPMGMFEETEIDNDLKFVDETIRSYYEIGAVAQ